MSVLIESLEASRSHVRSLDTHLANFLRSHLPTIKIGLQTSSYYLLPAVLFVASLLFSKNIDYLTSLGSIALALLTGILFITPIVDITRLATLQLARTCRREFGVASFWLFLFHTLGFVYYLNINSITSFLQIGSYLFYGGVAAIGMCILTLTSNNLSVKLLKRNWKRIQYIAIPTYFFALAHAYTADDEPVFIAIAIFSLYLFLRFLGKYLRKTKKTLF